MWRACDASIEVLLPTQPSDDPIWLSLVHIPGTVLRSTDLSQVLAAAFARISRLELEIDINLQPTFLRTDFRHSDREPELAVVDYADLSGVEVALGSWHNIKALPEHFVEFQRGFITEASAALLNADI